MVSFVQLEYVIAVDTYRNFSSAAEHCFVTQPTLSMQIKKLEDQLGVMIFDRSKQPVIPTDVGEHIILQARRVLREANKISEIITDYQGEIAGGLKVGIIPTLAPYLLPLFVGAFTRRYPGVALQVKEMVTEEIEYRLKKDLLDVGILVTPLGTEDIAESAMFYEEIFVYSSPLHRFSDMPTVPFEEAAAAPDLWLLGEGHCFRHQMLNLCSHKALEAKLPFAYESGSLETLKMLVDKEGGFTLLPELAIQNMSAEQLMRVKSFTPTSPLREVSLATVRNYAKDRLRKILAEAISQSVPPKMLDKNRGVVVGWN